MKYLTTKSENIMKPYDKNDNDTYVEKYSNSPSSDVEIHMYQDSNGRSSYGAKGIRGDFTVESAIRASNNVLHFPKARDVDVNGFTEIKKKKLGTLYPMSLVQRYDLEEDSLEYHQNTPVFFDPKKEKFVVLMDYRFCRDIVISELGKIDGLVMYNDKKSHSIIYIGITYDTIAETTKSNETFDALKEAYINYKMTLQQGEKVIIVRTETLDDDKLSIFNRGTYNLANYLGKSIFSTSFDFEFAVAFRFKDRYYLIDEDGLIIRKSAFFIKKEEVQKSNNKIEVFNGIVDKNKQFGAGLFGLNESENQTLFVTAYSEEQFEIVKNVKQRIHEIHAELSDLFGRAATNSNELDESILSLPSGSTIKKLTDNR